MNKKFFALSLVLLAQGLQASGPAGTQVAKKGLSVLRKLMTGSLVGGTTVVVSGVLYSAIEAKNNNEEGLNPATFRKAALQNWEAVTTQAASTQAQTQVLFTDLQKKFKGEKEA